MSSRFVRFDPETVQLLDRCIARALEIAGEIDPKGRNNETRFASALIEAAAQGERDDSKLLEFALQVLPAYREGRFRGALKVTAANPAEASARGRDL